MRRALTTPKRARVDTVVKLAASRLTLGTLCDKLAATYGDRTALTLEEPCSLDDASDALSYADLARIVARVAGALAEAGVEPGDRVAVCTANRVDYALTCFAVVRAGAVAVPLHHHLKPAEVEALVMRARATHLVADGPHAITRVGLVTIAELPPAAAMKKAMPLDAKEPALILFTSGTTGAPKGATITSRSLLAVARLAALVPDARKERGICGLPLAHVMGMSTLLCALLAGAPLHWVSKFDARLVLERIQERRATFFIGVPAMYAMFAEAGAERFDLSSIKLWASGADVMPPALVERFRKLGCALHGPRGKRLLTAAFAEIYGMVELSGPAILKLTPPGPFDDGPLTAPVRAALARTRARLRARVPRLTAAVGRSEPGPPALGVLIPPYRARIVDADGRPVKAGAVGELVLRGPGVTSGYDADPEATARTTHDGWLRTGDLAWRSRTGLVGFATRQKDVVKHGGYSVFPAEVEAQLGVHPQIAQAVVFGLPHPEKGAVPAAAVVLVPGARVTARELLAWARDHIASYKAPRALAVVQSGDIPRNANNKVLKDALRDALVAAGALQTAGDV